MPHFIEGYPKKGNGSMVQLVCYSTTQLRLSVAYAAIQANNRAKSYNTEQGLGPRLRSPTGTPLSIQEAIFYCSISTVYIVLMFTFSEFELSGTVGTRSRPTLVFDGTASDSNPALRPILGCSMTQ